MPTQEETTPSAAAREMPDEVDLLIVGGGIVGAGVARDAAMRGLNVLLVEQQDFAGGTSSRSSRLLHGGLRYLAQGRIGLVREASVEKRVLSHIAPHLFQPLPFVFPVYRGAGWPLWKLRVGVKLYDLLCGGHNFGKSTSLDPDATDQQLPGLERAGLVGAVRYFDGLTNDARLVIDTLRSAVNHGAAVRNYVRMTEARQQADHWRCELEATDGDGEPPRTVTAKAVVNAAGPWGDRFAQSQVHLRLTKGVHLVVDRARLPVHDAGVITEGARILFVIPWGERVILGTTDTDYQGDPAKVEPGQEDVAYILGAVNGMFPSASLSQTDVLSQWAGLRPLQADPRGKPSDISRHHQIRGTGQGWWDISGGKLTTYRRIAQQAVDRIVREAKMSAAPCQTADQPLLDSPNGAGAAFSGVVPPALSREAVHHYCEREWAVHLEDVMIRRSSWAHYLWDDGQVAEEVADWMAEQRCWSPSQRDSELERYQSAT